jgi:Na+/H+ antiporter NhaD/arsenite permease-like protein
MPWIMFALAAALTAVGAVSPGAVAIIAPIALGFAVQYRISPLLMGLMVIHGAQAGGFSPISIYGGITNGVVEEAGLPLNEVATFLASLFVNLAVAVLLLCSSAAATCSGGGSRWPRGRSATRPNPPRPAPGRAGPRRGRGPASLRPLPGWPRRRMVTPRWRPAPRSGNSSGPRGRA